MSATALRDYQAFIIFTSALNLLELKWNQRIIYLFRSEMLFYLDWQLIAISIASRNDYC